MPKQWLSPQVVGQMFAGMGVATAGGMLLTVRAHEKALGRAAREDEFEPINWSSLQKAKNYTAEQVFNARAVFDQVGRSFDLFLHKPT